MYVHITLQRKFLLKKCTYTLRWEH